MAQRCLITTGAAQSNHCRQTAAVAARMGYSCHLVLTGDPKDSSNGNLLLDSLFGTEITWCEKIHRDEVLSNVFESAWNNGKRPFLIPYGGSSPIGAAAYASAFSELVTQGVITRYDHFRYIIRRNPGGSGSWGKNK